MEDVGKFAMPREQMDRIWALYRSHPTVGACAQIISHALFSGGVLTNGNQVRVQHITSVRAKGIRLALVYWRGSRCV